MTTPLSYWEEINKDTNISRLASAAITDHVFAFITPTETISLATAGGKSDGVTVAAVSAATDRVTLYTEGAVLVKAGGTVTAGKDVMSDSAGKAVDATFGNLLLGYAETGTTTVDDLVRVRLYKRPQHLFGSGLGAEKCVALTVTGAALHAATTLSIVNPETADVIITRAILYTTTVSSGAATVDVGTTSASATTVSDNLLDGINAAVTAPNAQSRLAGDATTNSKDSQVWTNGKWVTISELADTTGFVGKLFIFYVIPA